MTETSITQDLMVRIKRTMRGAEPMKHADKFNTGYPDLSNTWRYVTSWWEIKFYNDRMFEAPVLQHIQCQKLERQGICFYVIYDQRKSSRMIRIVRPQQLKAWESTPIWTTGFDHNWVARFIMQRHLDYAPTRPPRGVENEVHSAEQRLRTGTAAA